MPEVPALYTICPSNDSTVAVEVSQTGLMRRNKYTVFFENFRGEMHFNGQDPAAFQVILRIDATSVVCRDASLGKKKRRAITEFANKQALAADVHREIQFTSTCVKAKALRGFQVEGLLQIRGATAQAKLNLVLNPMPSGGFQLDGDAVLRLSDFGLPRPSAMLGLVRTADEAVAHVMLWAVPQATGK